jgi:hypothetical protein
MKSTPQQGNFDTCWFCSLIPPPIPPITKSHVFIRRRIRNSTPSLVRTWTATRHPNIPVIAGLSDTTERTANAVQINEAKKKMESSISRALLASSMSQNRRNETIPPIQSKNGAPRGLIALSLEASSKSNLDAVGSAITKYSEREWRQDVAQHHPDGSRPTHSVPMEPAGNNSTPEASAKVVLVTSLHTHIL